MNTTAIPPLAEHLAGFFTAFGQTQNAPAKPSLAACLSGFFERFAACRYQAPATVTTRLPVDAIKLGDFLAELAKPLEASRQGAFHFDPWEVAGLRDNEVRNSGVLAWLLNPHASHGFGHAGMTGLLTTVNRHSDGKFPVESGQFCRVRTETNPNGEMADRVDIEIDAENFYLIIEVKIYAPEQAEQLERYCRQAKERAGSRPWAIIFLTPSGRKPSTAGRYSDSVGIVPLSWKKLAAALERKLPRHRSTPGQALSVSRQIAEQAARRFLNKVCLF